jgi:hypothetical protein
VSSLRKRLRKLERSGVLPCSECGLTDDAEVKYNVLTHEEGKDKPEVTEYCPRCGRMTYCHVKLTWD